MQNRHTAEAAAFAASQLWEICTHAAMSAELRQALLDVAASLETGLVDDSVLPEAVKHTRDMLWEIASATEPGSALRCALIDLSEVNRLALVIHRSKVDPTCTACGDDRRGYTATHCASCAAEEAPSYDAGGGE